eukprot:scpid33398/ scgid10068/ 
MSNHMKRILLAAKTTESPNNPEYKNPKNLNTTSYTAYCAKRLPKNVTLVTFEKSEDSCLDPFLVSRLIQVLLQEYGYLFHSVRTVCTASRPAQLTALPAGHYPLDCSEATPTRLRLALSPAAHHRHTPQQDACPWPEVQHWTCSTQSGLETEDDCVSHDDAD